MLGGVVGDSGAGLHLVLNEDAKVSDEDRQQLLSAHLEPKPQVDLGRMLATGQLATAMIDVSDGVLQDLSHIAAESGVGADVDADVLPLSDAARRLAKAAGVDPRDWGLSGGEDYVLLFCVPKEKQSGIEATPIGTITAEQRIRVCKDGNWKEVSPAGWDHFG
jgi:thiamine-monophosphate kinase